MKILVTATSFMDQDNTGSIETLKGFADELVLNPFKRPMTAGELVGICEGCYGIIAGLDHYDSSFFEAAPESLKVISRYGVGYDRVDIAAARKRNITVTNTPGVNSESVADLTFGLMLAVARHIPQADREIREGAWPRFGGVELFGKSLGILGLGSIGKAVALRAGGFSMKVSAYDPYIDVRFAEEHGIRICSFDEIIAGGDFISVHLPLNGSTSGLIGSEAIAGMKSDAIVINTARGGIVDEKAMYEALTTGRIRGYGADAFDKEPPVNEPLLTLPNVVATPHSGSHTREAKQKMAALSVRNLIEVLSGRECDHVVR
ncbi:MAG: phosphoglycerate dehydrogenase [Eubacteriales bacterium]|nr:phosphoglycerate dehydrogenase [Eubacteriales bacterium]MDD4327783.1 phosphoglycerate dehydrogenase [Eubacteriales bacterium]MDD4717463.1 phosphoglycerate dehydrogenase [Eubacteriales bacterium]